MTSECIIFPDELKIENSIAPAHLPFISVQKIPVPGLGNNRKLSSHAGASVPVAFVVVTVISKIVAPQLFVTTSLTI